MTTKRKYHHTEHTDRMIRDFYATRRLADCDANIRALCQRMGWPRGVIYKRAVELGVARPRKKEPPWSTEEMDLLEEHAHKNLNAIVEILQRHGYKRTAIAVATRRNRYLAGVTDARIGAGRYSARAAAVVMGVSENSIRNWIKQGMLRATRRGTARVETQGGDEWEITQPALREFVIEYTAHVPFQRVDKFWLVDLLVGSKAGAKAA
jgi:hypothetical protein